LGIGVLVATIIEACRLKGLFDLLKKVRGVLREEEAQQIGAYYFFFLGAFLTVLIFDVDVAATSIAAGLIGDAMAAIGGKALGKKVFQRSFNTKSAEGGLIGGVAAALTVIAFTGKLAAGLIALIVFIPVEMLSRGAYDNLTLPLSVGFALTALKRLIT